MSVWRALVDAAFPTWCPGCGGRASPVCASCAATLRPAVPAPPPVGVDRWLAAFSYEGVARELIARMKYRHERATAPWLAQYMAQLVADAGLAREPLVVTFAPTTARRRHERGFDHAEVLSRTLAHALQLPARSLLRRQPGPPQTGRPAALRRAGPCFEPRVRPPSSSVLLVDDVATTGATIAAAAAALRANDVRRVIAVTAARTPPPGGLANDGAYTRFDGGRVTA